MNTKIIELAKKLETTTIERRRDFHKFAEAAWTEYRTASIVADILAGLGYAVFVGPDVLAEEAMMGVPTIEELEKHEQRAITQGANPQWVAKMKHGKTGVMGIMKFDKPGPTVALRFDIDANDVVETQDPAHKPVQDSFVSVNYGAMHACGHDGHAAIGLAVAEILASLRGELAGTVKIIFQPAEEGVRGGKAMVYKGIVDDAQYMLALHLGLGLQTGEMSCQPNGILATSKIDAIFTGVSAHAGVAPETGRNAMMAAATALINLHAISRHSKGMSRINVGVMNAGTGRNVIPDKAVIKLETRGTTSDINEYVYQEAVRIINASADMHAVKVDIKEMGSAQSAVSDAWLVDHIQKLAEESGLFSKVLPSCVFGGSDDYAYFMNRVQELGGKSTYLGVGATLAAGHHNSYFDFDEKALNLAVILTVTCAVDLLK